jgi:hypothetical protein
VIFVTVVTKDLRRHVFKDQPEDIAKDLTEVVSDGGGFVLSDHRHGAISYAPGSVLRVRVEKK